MAKLANKMKKQTALAIAVLNAKVWNAFEALF